ncbi:HEAT repeat domain-containing protein [Schlesneria sp. T3-172]|uniref:HEAT repeat domain-containing protein n=1 Tax=Schlesneria sphaerica TaxID=3373610 RepID=UPI0037C92347
MKRIAKSLLLLLGLSTQLVAQEVSELDAITKRLDSKSLREKVEAVRLLGEIGSPASASVASLLPLLEEEDPGVRYEAIIALGRIHSESEQVVPALTRQLEDRNPVIHHAAINALRDFESDAESALPKLRTFMKDKSPLIRLSAARAVAEISKRGSSEIDEARSVLVESLQSPHPQIAGNAISGLVILSVSALPEIVALLDSKDVQTVCNACSALAAIGPSDPKTIGKLAELAKSDNAAVRWHAVTAIGEGGQESQSALPVLIGTLKDEDANVRFSAQQALYRLGEAAVPALIDALDDEETQLVATSILGGMGPAASSAAGRLANLVESPNHSVRREAVFALASIGGDATSHVPELIKALEDKQFPYPGVVAYCLGRLRAKDAKDALRTALDEAEDPLTRLAIACALIDVDPKDEDNVNAALPHVTSALRDERPQLRREAIFALGRMGERAKVVAPVLSESIYDPDPVVRREALVALAEMAPKGESAIKLFVDLLGENDPTVRSVASYALGRIGKPAHAATAPLQQLLESPDLHEKTLAAWALVRVSPEPKTKEVAIPLLVAALHGDKNPQMRLQMAQTLGEVGEESALAKEALELALKDSDEAVRTAADKAINSWK